MKARTAALIRLEITRALRNRKFLFFSVIYPSALFLLIAGSADSTTKVDGTGLTLPTFYMVSMASFGALTAVLMGNSERIAKERESGWVRQLRLTTLPGRGYVLAKTASAAVISLPSIVIVFVRRGSREGRTPRRLAVAGAHRRDLGRQPGLRRARRRHRLPRQRGRGPPDHDDRLLRSVDARRSVDAEHDLPATGCRTSRSGCPRTRTLPSGSPSNWATPRTRRTSPSSPSPSSCSRAARPGCTGRTR